jgi:ABC-type molybdate transport system substrate-binding protein
VIASYPIAVTSKAGTPALAAAFIDFILSAEGQKVLADSGFEPVR